MITIFVDTEKEKEQLIKESEYIHDFISGELIHDSCNTLSHIYMNPNVIKVITEVDLSDKSFTIY